ncbi:DUF498-domain-containing protein [Irpex lacteus]|nr:DUF498-domain-containing protein [Irpex lacteus]
MLVSSAARRSYRLVPIARQRPLHTTSSTRSESPTHFTNILAGANAVTAQVKSVAQNGIHLEDGRIIPGPCILLEGKVFLWNVPQPWTGWSEEHFEVFKSTVPKPELLLFGTGSRTTLPPANIRRYLGKLGVTTEFMDTRNACSTYNLLAEEGRRVAAALLPQAPYQWNQNKAQATQSSAAPKNVRE